MKSVKLFIMDINLDKFKKTLAENKVFDAWLYTESLLEVLGYMSLSLDLINAIYSNRISTIEDLENEKREKTKIEGHATFNAADFKKLDLNVGGYIINDSVLLKKTVLEFFHYARVSFDMLFQIVNAAILGDSAVPPTSKLFIPDLMSELYKNQEFLVLHTMLDNNRKNAEYEYLRAFDNYNKHIGVIPITLKNSILIGKNNTFMLNEFYYEEKHYNSEDALSKVTRTQNYIMKTIEEILKEVQMQVPHCIDNRNRYQSLRYKQVCNKNRTEHESFFIEVKNNVSELGNTIKVLPLTIDSNGKINYFNFRYKKIFIVKENSDEIIGCADLKRGVRSDKLYKTFSVNPCTDKALKRYNRNFLSLHQGTFEMNYHAFKEGQIVFK